MKYVVKLRGHAIALLCFSACAYHLADRDRHIGWSQAQCIQRRHFAGQNQSFPDSWQEKAQKLGFSRLFGLR